MPQKNAIFEGSLSPPKTPGVIGGPSRNPENQQRSRSSEPSVPTTASSRSTGVPVRRRQLSSSTANSFDDRLPSPTPTSAASPTVQVALRRTRAADWVSDKSPPLQADEARQARPSPLTSESAPALGSRRPDLLSEDRRSATDPGQEAPASGKGKSKAPKGKVESASIRRIDADIENAIKEPIKQIEDAKRYGRVYIMVVEVDGKQLVKVGYTAGTVYGRADKINYDCGMKIKIKSCHDSRELLFYKKVETLAKMELRVAQLVFHCDCKPGKTSHTEYFDVDTEAALRIVRRWSDFCSRTPYNRSGKLSKVWQNRLRDRARLSYEVDSKDVAQLSAVWDEFLNITWIGEVRDEFRVAVDNFNNHPTPVPIMFLTLLLLHVSGGSSVFLMFHSMSIIYFTAKAMTEDSPLSSRIFRAVNRVPSPWETRHILPVAGVNGRAVSEDISVVGNDEGLTLEDVDGAYEDDESFYLRHPAADEDEDRMSVD